MPKLTLRGAEGGTCPEYSACWLRRRFADPPQWRSVISGDGYTFHKSEDLRKASVLIPLVQREIGLTVLFTRRSAHLHNHAGQISFPGGRAEDHDVSPEHTALRESEEEVGLSPERVEVLGLLREYVTVTGYRVMPVVGLVSPPLNLMPDEFEVAEIFEVPLAYLLDPSNHQKNSVIHQGRRRQYYAFAFGPHYIWGATAGMVMNLHAFLIA